MVERAGFEPAYGNPGQIYSLLPLTTRPPLQAVRRAQWRASAMLSTKGKWSGQRELNASEALAAERIERRGWPEKNFGAGGGNRALSSVAQGKRPSSQADHHALGPLDSDTHNP